MLIESLIYSKLMAWWRDSNKEDFQNKLDLNKTNGTTLYQYAVLVSKFSLITYLSMRVTMRKIMRTRTERTNAFINFLNLVNKCTLQ